MRYCPDFSVPLQVIVECQRHTDYKEAIEFFLERAENYTHVAQDATSQGADKGLAVRNDSNFQQAENQLRTLLERFANGAPMQPIFDAVNQLYTDASNDEELRYVLHRAQILGISWFSFHRNYFKKLDHYVRQVLQEPGYIMKEACRLSWSTEMLALPNDFYLSTTSR